MDIESYRIRMKMSVAELAEKLGVGQAAIYNYKYGKSKPSYDAIEKMLLDGATIAEIFSDDVQRKVIQSLKVQQPSPEEYSEIVRQGILDLLKQSQK